MRPENVLSEERIRERFKFSRIPQHEVGDQLQPLQTTPPSPHHHHNYIYNTNPCYTLPHPFPCSSFSPPHSGHPPQLPAPSPVSTTELSPVLSDPSYVRVSVIKKAPQGNSENECEIMSSSSDSDNCGDSNILALKRPADFCVVKNSPPRSAMDYSLNQIQDDDFLILDYVHKKFKRSIMHTRAAVDDMCPRDEADVRAVNIMGDLGDSMDQDIDVSDLESLMYQLTPKLQNLETERTLMEGMKNSFDACWRSINFGEKAWSAYIDFCAGKVSMDPRIWSFAFFQVR